MAKDDFKNLGFEDDSANTSPGKDGAEEKGEIGELRW